MKKISTFVVGVFCALLLATSAFSADTAIKTSTNAPVAVTTVPTSNTGVSYLWNQPKVDDQQWTFMVGGSGATGLKSDSETVFGLDLSIGRTTQLVLPFELGLRQSVGYASKGEDTVLLTTKAYADWTLISYKKIDLFAGGNIGATYGNTPMVWTAAPETGVRYWIAKNVGIEGRLEFPFAIGNDTKFQNAMTYTIGLKAKF